MITKHNIKKQNGAVLAIALILLILVTLLGITGIRTSSLEEKMTANSYDRNIAFQSAEAALRQGEIFVSNNAPIANYVDTDTSACPADGAAINNCTAGVCPPPDRNCPSRWNFSGFNGWVSSNSGLNDLAGTDPQYFIEYLGASYDCGKDSSMNNCKRYRITAISNPAQDRSTVVLQSIYAK